MEVVRSTKIAQLHNCTSMKMLADNIVVTCDEIVDNPEIISIKSANKTNYWFIRVILLAITCLLFLTAIVVQYFMKRRLTYPCIVFLYR